MPSKWPAYLLADVAFLEELFDAVDATAVSRQVAADLDVQLFQLEFVLIEYRVPQLRLLLLQTQHINSSNDRLLLHVGQTNSIV